MTQCVAANPQEVESLCLRPNAERGYVPQQSAPTLGFGILRARASLLHNYQIQNLPFVLVQGRQRMHLSGGPTCLLRNVGLEVLAFVLVKLWFELGPELTKAVVRKSMD